MRQISRIWDVQWGRWGNLKISMCPTVQMFTFNTFNTIKVLIS